MEFRSLSVSGPFSLLLGCSERRAGRPRPWAGGRKEGLAGALIAGPGEGLEEVVEEAGAQSFVHPLAGEQHVVDLVHALDVACAVLLLGLQAQRGVCRGKRDVIAPPVGDTWHYSSRREAAKSFNTERHFFT